MPAAASIALLLSVLSVVVAEVAMEPAEKEALLRVMESVSSDCDWRSSVAGADPCGVPWPGLERKPDLAATSGGTPSRPLLLHVTRLDFGVAPNPTCKDTTAFPHHAFALLPHLRSLFFVDCFRNPSTTTASTLPPSTNLSASRLQQLNIRSNPSLSGTLPPQPGSLRSLQVLTISQNALIRGEVPQAIGELKNMVHLDLSYNSLTGLNACDGD